MEQDLKERLVGATVLIILAALFIPTILSDEPVMEMERGQETEPVEAAELEYHSSIVPIEESAKAENSQSEEKATNDPLPRILETKTATQVTADKESAIIPPGDSDSADTESGENQAKKSKPGKTDVGTTQAWVVQLGSFNSEANAQTLNERLLKKKFPSFVEPLIQGDKVVYRVRVGPMLQKAKIETIRAKIKKVLKLDGILIKYP